MFKIGIMGAGSIAGQMAATAKGMKDVGIYAVASRNINKAQEFIKRHGILNCRAYGSYEELAEDEEVDLIYVATPHSEHFGNMMLCIDKGKNVLCEKAFTVNAKQALQAIDAAKSRGVYLAEAMWTRYMPLMDVIDKIAKGDVIGRVNMMTANMHFPMREKERLWTPKLAGGALLDVGIYPLTMAVCVFGTDIRSINVMAKLSDNGLDEKAAAQIEFENGGIADINWGMTELSDCKALIYGEGGFAVVNGINRIHSIEIYASDFNKIATYNEKGSLVEDPDEHKDEFNLKTGYEYEVCAAMDAIRNGRPYPEKMDWNTSIRMMEIMDEIREKMGVRYECDET